MNLNIILTDLQELPLIRPLTILAGESVFWILAAGLRNDVPCGTRIVIVEELYLILDGETRISASLKLK